MFLHLTLGPRRLLVRESHKDQAEGGPSFKNASTLMGGNKLRLGVCRSLSTNKFRLEFPALLVGAPWRPLIGQKAASFPGPAGATGIIGNRRVERAVRGGVGKLSLSQRKESERIIWTRNSVSRSFLLASLRHVTLLPAPCPCSCWPASDD